MKNIIFSYDEIVSNISDWKKNINQFFCLNRKHNAKLSHVGLRNFINIRHKDAKKNILLELS